MLERQHPHGVMIGYPNIFFLLFKISYLPTKAKWAEILSPSSFHRSLAGFLGVGLLVAASVVVNLARQSDF